MRWLLEFLGSVGPLRLARSMTLLLFPGIGGAYRPHDRMVCPVGRHRTACNLSAMVDVLGIRDVPEPSWRWQPDDRMAGEPQSGGVHLRQPPRNPPARIDGGRTPPSGAGHGAPDDLASIVDTRRHVELSPVTRNDVEGANGTVFPNACHGVVELLAGRTVADSRDLTPVVDGDRHKLRAEIDESVSPTPQKAVCRLAIEHEVISDHVVTIINVYSAAVKEVRHFL